MKNPIFFRFWPYGDTPSSSIHPSGLDHMPHLRYSSRAHRRDYRKGRKPFCPPRGHPHRHSNDCFPIEEMPMPPVYSSREAFASPGAPLRSLIFRARLDGGYPTALLILRTVHLILPLGVPAFRSSSRGWDRGAGSRMFLPSHGRADFPPRSAP